MFEERMPLLDEAWKLANEIDDVELLAGVVNEGLSGVVVPVAPWPSRAAAVGERLDETSDQRILFTAVLARVRSQEVGDKARELAEWALARASTVGERDRRASDLVLSRCPRGI